MSYVMASPDLIAAAAADVAALGSTVNAAHIAAAASTVALVPAAADEVSTGVAQLFSGVGQEFHHLAGQAAAFNAQFVQHLTAGAGSYAATEVASAASMMPSVGSYVDVINGFVASISSQLTAIYNTVEQAVQQILGVLELIVMVPYEALVLSYLSLALLIGAIQLLTKYLGVTIPIP